MNRSKRPAALIVLAIGTATFLAACSSSMGAGKTTDFVNDAGLFQNQAAPSNALARNAWRIGSAPSGSSTGGNSTAVILDGKESSIWTSSANQVNTMALQVDLGSVQNFKKLVLEAGNKKNFLRSYNIYVSSNPNSWGDWITGGSGNTKARLELDLGAQSGRYLTIQNGYDTPGVPWSIAELWLTGATSVTPTPNPTPTPTPNPTPNPTPTPTPMPNPTPGARVWKILPLGDSNTAGGGYENAAEKLTTHYSYRGNLFNRLKTAGYNIDYLGTRQAGSYPGVGTPETSYHGNATEEISDKNHSGYGGFSMYDSACNFSEFPSGICSIGNNLNAILAGKPDIVLLMIGHNGAGNKPAELERLVNEIKTKLPNTVVFTGGYPNLSGNLGAWQDLRDKARSLANPARGIYYVDLNNVLPNASDFVNAEDNVHHSRAGAVKVASRFYNALEPYLRSR